MSQQHIVIIDGLSFLFRAYHAVRQGLTRSDGTPTNALFGFAQMLVKVVDDLKPDVCLVALDSVGPTFRKGIYPEYKAHRPPPEPAMLVQLKMFQPLVEAFGIAAVRVEGFEADDVIATVVQHYCAETANGGCRVTIVSSDKDLMQLIGPNVKMFDTLKDKWIGEAEVIEKFGVGPDKVIEVQALIGDSSDNVPGVRGIGPKGAAELIVKFADVDGIYANIAQVDKPKMRESLEENKAKAYVSRELVTLKRDVVLPVGWNELNFRPKLEVAAEYLEEELEFKTLAGRLRKRAEREAGLGAVSARFAPPRAEEESRIKMHDAGVVQSGGGLPLLKKDWYSGYECVRDVERWKWWVQRIRQAGQVALDTETTGLDPLTAELVGVCLAVGEGDACYVPLGHRINGLKDERVKGSLFGDEDEEVPLVEGQVDAGLVLGDLRGILADEGVRKIGHNLKYDWLVLAKAYGVVLAAGEDLQKLIVNYEDTMLLSACVAGGRWNHGLDTLAERHLQHTMIKYEEVAGKGKAAVTFDKVPLDAATRYGAEDADATFRLWQVLGPQLVAGTGRIYLIEKELLPVVASMEARGVRVDGVELRRLSDDFGLRMVALEAEIHGLAGHGFNVNSPTQLAVVLFDEMGLGTERQRKNRSTAVGVLEDIADDLEDARIKTQGAGVAAVGMMQAVLQYRQLAKLRSTYTEALLEQVNPVTGRVHTSYMQIGASTGRFSSTEPNLQNIPIRTEEGRKVRKAFIPREGWVMVSADYSQIELRLLAHMSGSVGLRKAFNEGADIHTYTAALIRGIGLDQVSKEQRRAAKFINFGLVYGMGAASLAKQIGVGKDEAAAWIAAYFERYDGVKDYMEQNKAFARQHGYVETLLGRRVWLADIQSSNGGLRSNAERAAINAPLQGSNADIIKVAMPKVEAELGRLRQGYSEPSSGSLREGEEKARLLMQVHDELVLEAHPDVVPLLKVELPKVMGGVVQLAVPLLVEVGVGPNWEEAH